MTGRRVRRDGQAGADVVGQDGRAVQGCVDRGGDAVVECDRSDSDGDRGRRRLSGCVGGGVGEGVKAGVTGGRRVRIRAVGGNRDGAVRRRRVGRNRERGALVVGQDRGSVESGVGRGTANVVGGDGCDRDGHGGGGRLTRPVRCGVGEGVRSGVTGGRRVGVRAVGCNRNCSVRRRGVRRDR